MITNDQKIKKNVGKMVEKKVSTNTASWQPNIIKKREKIRKHSKHSTFSRRTDIYIWERFFFLIKHAF